MDISFLERMVSMQSVSGDETDVSNEFRSYLKEYCSMQSDIMNNTYAWLYPHLPRRILLDAHSDEIGFTVTYVDDYGYVYVRACGGIDWATVPGSRVMIKTRNGEAIPGVIGKCPIHIQKSDARNKVPESEELWVDTGFDKEYVFQHIKVGDSVGFYPNFIRLGNYKIASKGLDNKVGVFIVAEAMRQLSERELNFGVCGVASVQEEVGCKGARVEFENLCPDIAICIDTGVATDVPNISVRKYGVVNLGGGVVITMHTDSNRQLSLLAEDVAVEFNIPYQLSAHHQSSGGTNAAVLQTSGKGVITLLIGIPCRYLHTQVELCDLRDIESAITLLVELVCKLNLTQMIGVRR